MPNPFIGLSPIIAVSEPLLAKAGIVGLGEVVGKGLVMAGEAFESVALKGKAPAMLSFDALSVGKTIAPVRQGLNRCGPASLETITKMLDVPGYDQQRIAREILSLPKRYDWSKFPGTSMEEITAYLKKHPQLTGKLHQVSSFADAEKGIQTALKQNKAVMMAIDIDTRAPDIIKGGVAMTKGESPIVGHWVVIRGHTPSAQTYQVYDVLSKRFAYDIPAAKLAKQWSFDLPKCFDFLTVGHR